MDKPKILVTGGLGYIGSHTVVELLENNFDVVIVDNLSNSPKSTLERIEKITKIKPKLYILDVANEKEFSKIFKTEKDITGIIHFAAYKSVGESVLEPLKYYHNNLCSTMNVLSVMQEYKIPYLIFSSSASIYGEPSKLPVDENEPVKSASSPYGNTKQIGEEMICDFSEVNPETKILALRYFNPIGAHPSGLIGENPNGIPNNLLPYITQTVAGKRDELKIFGNDYDTPDGTGIRDYLHVVDLAQAHVMALKYLLEEEYAKGFDVVNLGTGMGYSVLDIVKTFERVTGKNVPFSFAPRRDGDVPAVWADPSKAKKVLKWEAHLGLEEMLSSAWKWEEEGK